VILVLINKFPYRFYGNLLFIAITIPPKFPNKVY